MKRVGEGQPYLSFALIVRNASETLEACLKSLRERAPEAEIVIVDTCSGDYPPQLRADGNGEPETHLISKRYADVFEVYKGPKGTWTDTMYAFDDAAAARNRSFELATGKWICWVDADDVIPSGTEAEKLLKLNARWAPSGNVKDSETRSFVDFLKFVDAKFPDIEGFRCPYLYRKNEDGTAVTWQERERIVRNNGKWHWQRPAHEILVPKDPQLYAKMHTLSHLLFVHLKKFTQEDTLFSLQRHFNILIKEYDSGLRHVQGLLYLENFSIFLCPQRREEFIAAAYEAASLPIDRARVLIRAGNFAVEQGFYFDAVEHFGGAVQLAPTFPDAWIAGAHAFEKAGNPLKAAEWFLQGVAQPADCNVSDINPRAQAIEFRIRAALLLAKGSKQLTQAGRHMEAAQALESAVAVTDEALRHPAIGNDHAEALFFRNLFQNELDGIKATIAIDWLHKLLVRNDETEKAAKLLDVVPHHVLDHPTIMGIEQWKASLEKHMKDPEAYRKFYDEIGTDVVSCMNGLDYDTALPRVKFVIDWIKANCPNAKVLEVGSFDGITALPILRSCPGVAYTAIETQASAIKRMIERADQFGVGGRLMTHQALDADELKKYIDEASFDVVIFYEVIEHVPYPRGSISRLLKYVKPNGRLFLSTPWGAFDRGHPANMAERDARGHVRAMMPREIVGAVEACGGQVLELGGNHREDNFGDTIHLMAKRGVMDPGASFVVPSALWDWNASHVYDTGIGASEETIVYLARHMGLEGLDTEVFGPLPSHSSLVASEVRDGVKYWPREHLRHAQKDMPMVVSRAPGYGTQIDHPNKILWLQDAWYPDLSEKTVDAYRKVVVLTDWHKQTMHRNHGVPLEKMRIIPNFILREHFENQNVERKRTKFIYASSPDRGLINLLKIWPRIRKEIPEAELHIFYGWEGCMKLGAHADPTWTERYRKIRKAFMHLRHQPGIVERGRVNHVTIAREFLSAAAWLYPTAFDETGCLTAAKARAAGCIPVCSPRAALVETAGAAETMFVPMPADMDVLSDGVGVEAHPDWEAYASHFTAATLIAALKSDTVREAMAGEARFIFDLKKTVWPLWREVLFQK